MTDLNFFHKIFLLQDMNAEEMKEVLKIAKPQTFPEGAVIIHEGEAGTSVFFMERGEVEITKRLGIVLDGEVPGSAL